MDIDDILSGMSKAQVHDSSEILDKEDLEDTENVDSDESDEVDEEIVDDKNDKIIGETDEDYIAKFASELNYDGEVEGEGLEALLNIAKSKISVLNDPKIQEIINHVNKGGNVDTYQRMQPTDYFQSVELNEDDDELTEQAVKACLVNLRNFEDEDEIEKYIQSLKDEDKLFDYAKKHFPKLQAKELNENNNKKQIVEDELKKEQQEEKKFYADLEKSLNSLSGVVNKSLKEDVKKFSIPDSKGVIEVEEFLNGMKPNDIATMNYFAYCLKNNKEFVYKPEINKQVNPNKPIHQLLNKSVGGKDKGEKVLFKDFIGSRLK